jgi:capsular polysaccharide biosynthesis protein
MARPNYTNLILRGWGTIAMFGILGLVIALIISFLQPLKYSSTVRLLLIQDLGTVDAYTASRSVERLAENLATIVYTTSFFEEVMSAGFDIDESVFPAEEDKKRRTWSNMVSTSVARGSGLLTISVYHQDVAQGEQIVNAIAYVLQQQASSYLSSGGTVEVRVVDTALNSRWPAKPNIPANSFSGLVLGGLAGVGYILIQAERIRRRHQLIDEDFG